MGDNARRLMAEGGPLTLAHRFAAGSHIEAMTIYHGLMGYEPYTTEFPVVDGQPYPDEWRDVQERAGITVDGS
jgi:hypothetical protein